MTLLNFQSRTSIALTFAFLLVATIIKSQDFVFNNINVSQGLSDNQVRYILQLHDGRMVFKTSGNLNIFNGAHFKYIHHTSSQVYPLKNYDGFYRIYKQGDSLLWIKDQHKLMCLDLRQENYLSELSMHITGKGFQKQVEDVFIDTDDRLWLLSKGVLWRSDSRKEMDVTDNQGHLQDLATDENNLYLFYNTGNIVCYDLKTGKKQYAKAAYPEEQSSYFANTSLIVTVDNGFYQLRNGRKGGLFFFNTLTFSWQKMIETNYVLNTLVVTQEKAFVSCASGFWSIDIQKGEKQYLPKLKTIDGKVLDTEISTLFYDQQGGFWLGTLNQGLLYYHPGRYKFSRVAQLDFPVSSTKDILIKAFSEDRAGNIYIRSDQGVFTYNASGGNDHAIAPAGNHVTEIAGNSNPAPELKGRAYTAHHTDVRGWKWVGTSDGLMLIKPGQKEQIFYTDAGLSNNSVHAILEDRLHDLWITTSYGISRVRVSADDGKVLFDNFNSFDGTLDGEYSEGAAYQARDGKLYFGGVNGFNILNPNDIPEIQLPFKPVLANLYLHGTAVEIGKSYDGYVILPEAATYTENIELAYHQNFLTFEFSALNFVNPSKTYYRYQLEGIDPGWQESYTNVQQSAGNGLLRAAYTKLPPGEYVFKVMASTDGHRWTDIATSLKIRIHAPWWKSTIAYTMYVLSLLLAVLGAFRLHSYLISKRMERQHKEEILLLRIKNLIDQCNLLEAEKESYAEKTGGQEPTSDENSKLSSSDASFLAQAVALVEKNLDEPNYSVEALSRDLFMERSGLYRKLVALLDKSPSLFIRNIRLQRAAQLLREEELPVSEIAERVGFSSSSYLSKCFLEMYGCRPSEYAEKMKKSS